MSHNLGPQNTWTVTSLDPEIAVFLLGDYPPDEPMRVTTGGGVSARTGPGASKAVVTDTGSGARRATVAVSIRAFHNLHDVTADLESMDSLTRPDPQLGRRPRVQFYANGVTVEGYIVQSVREDLGLFAETPLPRGAVYRLELIEAPDVSVEVPDAPTGETIFLELGAGDTFESVAGRVYGDPVKGQHLRVLNAGIAESAGNVIKVLEPDHPKIARPVRPMSAALGSGFADLVDELAVSRATTKRGVPFDVFG